MTNREILDWWDSKDINERIALREKYNFSSGASLDVDDYRWIYDNEQLFLSKY